MNTKQMVMIGTIAAAITLGGSAIVEKAIVRHPNKSNAYEIKTPSRSSANAVSRKDALMDALGASSEEGIHDALYIGKSLAEIAAAHNKDVQAVIDLQISQMTAQLNNRLANGSITYNQYHDHINELTEIITRSTYALT